MRYVRILGLPKIYDLGDGSLDTRAAKEDGTWSAECLLEDIEQYADTETPLQLLAVVME